MSLDSKIFYSFRVVFILSLLFFHPVRVPLFFYEKENRFLPTSYLFCFLFSNLSFVVCYF
ncbi:hypothetical protein BC829DRAFT_54388 [Chytridium lagenaria]|nr:hypothetical protein BC829DRAFT_54388 [Chytridium lagenaria]